MDAFNLDERYSVCEKSLKQTTSAYGVIPESGSWKYIKKWNGFGRFVVCMHT